MALRNDMRPTQIEHGGKSKGAMSPDKPALSRITLYLNTAH